MVEELQKREPVMAWTIDDTGFPKQGKDSVGVQRQYSGTLGKIGNCQIGVSLTIATKHEHVPIDFALYMPASWTDDAARRKKVRVPVNLVFKTKIEIEIELALDLITRAVEDEIHGRDRARGCRVQADDEIANRAQPVGSSRMSILIGHFAARATRRRQRVSGSSPRTGRRAARWRAPTTRSGKTPSSRRSRPRGAWSEFRLTPSRR